MAGNSDPRLIKGTALAKVTQLESRVNALAAAAVNELSPTVVYINGATQQVSVNGSVISGGSWTCPPGVFFVQVEAWGGGGGGGGGNASHGGAGGGGGEYVLEQNYAVIPGNVYTFAVGRTGQGGVGGGAGGWPGGDTVFDTSGTGVYAYGGLGGDGNTQHNGGTGSSNSVHYDGGMGGVSSAGVNSDNLNGISNVLLWWRMDDTGVNGLETRFADVSVNNRYGSVTQGSGSSLKPAGLAAPPQVPSVSSYYATQGNAAVFSQPGGTSAAAYAVAPSFALGKGAASPNDGSKLTVSCWVKGNASLGAWGTSFIYGHTYCTLATNSNWPPGLHAAQNNPLTDGFALFIQNNFPAFYLNNSSEGVLGAIASITPISPSDGLWHQIVGTWDGTTMRLYQDGAFQVSAVPGFTDGKIAQGPSAIAAGVNAYNRSDSNFAGTMSNLWISASVASSTYIATAYGAIAAAGGSGGGASGGSAGAGNPGVSTLSTTGAAGGAAHAGADSTHGGSGAGAAGGNSGASGANAPVVAPYGGGGGGAGEKASPGAVSILSVQAAHSASYLGLDAGYVPPGYLYCNSAVSQAGIASPYPAQALVTSNMFTGGDPGSAYNGTMNSVAVLPNIAASLTGQNINSVQLAVTVQSTNASILQMSYAKATDIPLSLGSDSEIASYLGTVTPLIKLPVPAGQAGRQVTFDITDSGFVTALKSKTSAVALVFGGLQGSPAYGISAGSWNADDVFAWNTVLTGAGADDPVQNLTLNLETYPSSGANAIGGDGAPGALILSFVDTQYWPTASVQPSAITDSDGNQHSAGLTTDSIVGYDPTGGYPRIPAAWKSLGTLSAGSGLTVDTCRYRYAPDDGGVVAIQFSAHMTGTTINQGGYNFSVPLAGVLTPSVSGTGIYDMVNFPLVLGAGSNQLPFGILRVGGANNSGAGVVSIQIPSTLTVVAGYTVHTVVKIPLN